MKMICAGCSLEQRLGDKSLVKGKGLLGTPYIRRPTGWLYKTGRSQLVMAAHCPGGPLESRSPTQGPAGRSGWDEEG